MQAAALVFHEATIESNVLDFPAAISSGVLKLGEDKTYNVIPVPFDCDEKVVLRISLFGEAASEKLEINGSRMKLTLLGEAVYVEEFNP